VTTASDVLISVQLLCLSKLRWNVLRGTEQRHRWPANVDGSIGTEAAVQGAHGHSFQCAKRETTKVKMTSAVTCVRKRCTATDARRPLSNIVQSTRERIWLSGVRQYALFSCSLSPTEILRTLLSDQISNVQAATIACLSPVLLNTWAARNWAARKRSVRDREQPSVQATK